MTMLQPNKEKRFIGIYIALFLTPLLSGALWLVFLYNQTVNLQHALEKTQADFLALQTGNAELRDEFFTLFDGKNLEIFAKERELREEKNPRYLEIKGPWALVSR
ncbi:MAG: hypothetical protein AAB652_01225 [Patescibacteria group bacterium]